MRLYHFLFTLPLIAVLALGACTPRPTEQVLNQARVEVDDQTLQVALPPGETVKDALDAADITLGSLDRVEPPLHVTVEDGTEIVVTRMYEEFEVEEVVIPFEEQNQPSEYLPEGEEQQLQEGSNGLKEITYRIVYENGVEISKNEIKSVIIEEPVTQITLVGVRNSFTPRPIPGRLAYLSDGNALLMEGTTANRIPIVTTSDLDGRVFSLSDDGQWLLFSRRDPDDDVINRLWAVRIDQPDLEIDLGVQNVIHFADWKPGSTDWIAYSTVEPRQASPGWQANNNLETNTFSLSGWVEPNPDVVVETNSGGLYGWWGTDYAYAPSPSFIAYASPSQVGFVNLISGGVTTALEMEPFTTRSDWAWVPGIQWGPSGQIVYTVRHAPPPGASDPERSPVFNLTAIPLTGGRTVDLVSMVGMFAYPLPSPLQPKPWGETAYQIAYLQAIHPQQSDTSSYRLVVMDRDGSNKNVLFPGEGVQGFKPDPEYPDWGAWSPDVLEENHGLAVIYQGNIWLIDAQTGDHWQVTGDGNIERIDWR